jgi:hypothetical protein
VHFRHPSAGGGGGDGGCLSLAACLSLSACLFPCCLRGERLPWCQRLPLCELPERLLDFATARSSFTSVAAVVWFCAKASRNGSNCIAAFPEFLLFALEATLAIISSGVRAGVEVVALVRGLSKKCCGKAGVTQQGWRVGGGTEGKKNSSE